MPTRLSAFLASAFCFAAMTPDVFAQQIIRTQPTPRTTVVTPAQPQYRPNAFSRFPRVERSLQLLVDPVAYVTGDGGGVAYPSDRPLIDAAPNIVNIASIGLYFGGGPVLVILAFALPPTIRAVRVALYGSPVAGPPEDTLLWIAEPTLLKLRNRLRDRRANSQSPTYSYGYANR